MSIYTFIPVIFIVLYLGYWFYMKNKNSKQAQVVNNTDFKAEFANAEQYKKLCLNSDLSFLKEAMGEEKIDAFNYASNEYGVASALKDGMKDKLKGMATLGTVRFNTVQTPKYLVLSGDNLYLFDTDTDGEIDNHVVSSGLCLCLYLSLHRNCDETGIFKTRLIEYKMIVDFSICVCIE